MLELKKNQSCIKKNSKIMNIKCGLWQHYLKIFLFVLVVQVVLLLLMKTKKKKKDDRQFYWLSSINIHENEDKTKDLDGEIECHNLFTINYISKHKP